MVLLKNYNKSLNKINNDLIILKSININLKNISRNIYEMDKNHKNQNLNENDKDIDMTEKTYEKNLNYNSAIENKNTMLLSEKNHKVQLNFSVDRLLNQTDECNSSNFSSNALNNNQIILNNKLKMDFYLDNLNNNNSCCKNISNLANMLDNYQKINLTNLMKNSTAIQNCSSSNNLIQEYQQQTSNMDVNNSDLLINSIIKPTPIRIIHNNNSAPHPSHHIHPNFASNLQSVLKFQQITINSNNTINPLNSLQSLQTQQFRHALNSTRSNNLINRQIIPITTGIQTQSSSTGSASKRKRSWSRAVFSNLQRKGLEYRFQQQKYITKPDRRKLANQLNLTDAQVKVWFQNRRMKWRHTRENFKSGQEKPVDECNTSSDEGDEIDVVAE